MDITLWKRKTKEDYEYNHYEVGLSQNTHPRVLVVGSVQEGWKNSQWEKLYGTLVDSKITLTRV